MEEREQEQVLLTGYRFYPTEEELITFYLHNKLRDQRPDIDQVIPVFNIYSIEPWHLPEISGARCRADVEQWFFFVPRQEQEARGGRPNRTTASGYWKATGSPSYVYSSNSKVIGLKKAMVFYMGKAPTGRKTKWKMNEYRAIEEQEEGAQSSTSSAGPRQLRTEFTLCRVYVISGNFRAFDRRPLEGVLQIEGQLEQRSAGGTGTDHVLLSSRSGPVGLPEISTCGGISNSIPETTAHNLPQEQQQQPLLWDWEQLPNWP